MGCASPCAQPSPWAMVGMRLLLLLAFECPALPTGPVSLPPSPEVIAVPRPPAHRPGAAVFPSLAPPVTLLVGGQRRTMVVCLVLDAAPPGLDGSVWFSAGNGSALDTFTYGPAPATDGTWTALAQLSLPAEDPAAWEPLVCHAEPGAGGPRRSTQPLRLSASGTRTCLQEPPGGFQAQGLWLGALRLLLFKLLLLDVLLTCTHLPQPPAATGSYHPGTWPQ
ncbi:PREDICTED: pre T-cell antigen receptor alpha isoform X3 [Chinchilla lanigera]|uniref:pre T-cell antigen receptor alpha isoform X3 n=1 Tax=Chinchilla lanigera TaxID=34839 RepID=UPI00038E9A88|nr:PREDICTED: pre T-cell antigen receptor alpha isoform X3 [Chinchilla lanigera]